LWSVAVALERHDGIERSRTPGIQQEDRSSGTREVSSHYLKRA
jgi:hypothetical protein